MPRFPTSTEKLKAEGELVPTPEEVAERETQRAGQESQRADRLAAKLRELNIDPDTI